MTYLAEELLESITSQDVSVRLETRFTERLLKEFGHLKPYAEELAGFLLLRDSAHIRGHNWQNRNEHVQLQTCPQT